MRVVETYSVDLPKLLCFICHKEQAILRLAIEDDGLIINAVVCGSCLAEGEGEIYRNLLTKEGVK
jgi:hypothetical protein